MVSVKPNIVYCLPSLLALARREIVLGTQTPCVGVEVEKRLRAFQVIRGARVNIAVIRPPVAFALIAFRTGQDPVRPFIYQFREFALGHKVVNRASRGFFTIGAKLRESAAKIAVKLPPAGIRRAIADALPVMRHPSGRVAVSNGAKPVGFRSSVYPVHI